MTALRNASESVRRVLAVGTALHAASGAAAQQAAQAALVEARARVPVRTGRLRDSLTVRAEGTSSSVRTSCVYAAAVELGTSSQPARPYLHPAAQAQSRTYPALAARLAGQALRAK